MVKDIKCLFMLPKIFKTYLRKLSTFREIWEWCEEQGAGKVITFLVSLWRNVYENWYIIHALVFSTSLLLCPKTNTFSSWWSCVLWTPYLFWFSRKKSETFPSALLKLVQPKVQVCVHSVSLQRNGLCELQIYNGNMQ